MKFPTRLLAAIFVFAAVVLLAFALVAKLNNNTYTVEREDVAPAPEKYHVFEDDDLAGKNPAFDAALTDSRNFHGWTVNASAAVLALDVPPARDLDESWLLELYPSYTAAAKAVETRGMTLLPSINMLDGKGKQFDDGLYAELDAAMTTQKMKGFNDTCQLVRDIMAQLQNTSEAYAWLYGSLEVGGFLTPVEQKTRPAQAGKFVDAFNANPAASKPIGFYTWSNELQQTFRFLRFLQTGTRDRTVPEAIARVLMKDDSLRKRYETLLNFYAKLTNGYDVLAVSALADPEGVDMSLAELWLKHKLGRPSPRTGIYFLPPSTSKETVLFERMFGQNGLPPGADLMAELIKAIREGKVDLKPGEKSGWYEYQVYAIETLLLAERGAEHNKLQLSKRYKERMLQAFAALVTKRRETHVRQLALATKSYMEPPLDLCPRLRVEPNPTYYIRQARAYAFLETFLAATIPSEILKKLRGRKEGGERDLPLAEELAWMKNLFYGLHLISCEDIGMKPSLLDGELSDTAAAIKLAEAWLDKWKDDADLAVDTRVSIPAFVDLANNKTQLWNTIGVRGMKLSARYAVAPKWRAANDANSEWQTVYNTGPANYVILADEFASVTRNSITVLTRKELRALCDREKTKDKIVEALQR